MATTNLTGTGVNTESTALKGARTTQQRFSLKPSVIRDNITGYLFISPAIFLIFIFGVFPIGYALYMSVHVWIIERRNSLCSSTPLNQPYEEPAAHIFQAIERCLTHYQASAIGSWNGLFVTAIGFSAMFTAYWFWVNVFDKYKSRSMRGFLNWQIALLVLALSLIVLALNADWHPLVVMVLGAVIVLGAFWFWTGAETDREIAPTHTPLISRILAGVTVVAGAATVVWAVLSLGTMFSGVIGILQNFSISNVLVAYLGVVLLGGVYLIIVQDNDDARELPVTRFIDRVVLFTLRVLSLFAVGSFVTAVGLQISSAIFGSDMGWSQVAIGSLLTLVGLGAIGIVFSLYVLGDTTERLGIRGFIFVTLIVFTLMGLFGWQGVRLGQMIDVAGAWVAALLNGIEWSALGLFYVGLLLLVAAYRFWVDAFNPYTRRSLVRWVIALTILAVSMAVIAQGWSEMMGALSRRDQNFLKGMEITVFFAFGSIPLQLFLGLLLAYVLFQNIRGKEWFRMIFFLPYVTPAVAAAVVFSRIFTGSETALMNSFLDSIGADMQRWVNEPRPFLNVVFGLDLQGFLAGPSMALVSVIILGVWTYTGYNAVLFLAGLGGIPGDLYEAAKVDGASQWHLFRYITLPLLSPITFYLSLLGFIGTFQAFNTLFVMRTPSAQGTLDTAGLVIYDTFQRETRWGEAAALSISLFVVILILTQLQRSVFEKRVFYG
ncbi:MAG: ABC transporter permease subunit [Chloroflexota bacterium]